MAVAMLERLKKMKVSLVLTQVSTGELQKNFVSFSHKGDGVHENQMEILGY